MQRHDAAPTAPALSPWFWLAALAFVTLVGVLAAHHDTLKHVFDGAPPAVQWLRFHVVRPFHHSITRTVLHPLFLVLFPLILLLEWRMPARPQQRLFSVALANDALYVPLVAVTHSIFVVGCLQLLDAFYGRHLAFLTIDSVGELPLAVRVVWGVIVTDFLLWAQHRIKHAVPWFWQIHSVHHSQRDLNLFSDDRNHAFEAVVRSSLMFLPLRILCVDNPQIVFVSLALTWQARFYHCNVRTNLGPLRHLFVTPQSHRIHHSIEPGHQHRNFGAMLNVWDRLFGTHHAPGRDEYPATGVSDPSFPQEQDARGLRLLLVPFAQLLHPLKNIARSVVPVRERPLREVRG